MYRCCYGWRQDKKKKNSVELEASLAPAEAEVRAVAMADQNVIQHISEIQEALKLDYKDKCNESIHYNTVHKSL